MKGHGMQNAKGVNYGETDYQRIQRNKKMVVPLSLPNLSEDELAEIWEVFRSNWISKGPKCLEFEYMVQQFLDIDYAIAVTNCTSALHLSMIALGVGKGHKVIVPDYTFPATGFAPCYVGAEPILCDVDPLTYAMDPKALEMALIRNTDVKAIIVVHPFGQCANMDQIMKIANLYEVPVVEDAACAFGASYKNQFAGTFGKIGCFSLHARKGITTGEGGIIVTKDKKLADRMRKLSEFGAVSTWSRESNFFSVPTFELLGYNYKMSDILAAVGVVQLRKIGLIISKKRGHVADYAKILESEMPFLDMPYEDENGYHIYQSFVPLLKPEYRDYKNKIIQMFIENEVQCNIGTYSLHKQPFFQGIERFPASEDVFSRAIALPLYKDMGFSKIIKAGRKIWEKLPH